MSSTLASAAASATSSSCSTTDFTQFPTKDVACAVGSTSGLPSNTSDVLKNCCKTAPVESYANNCAFYCLSVDQTVADLQKCFMEGGVSPATIFCSGNNTASATGKPSGTASGTQTGATAGQSKGAASVLGTPVQGVSKAGLGMLAMIAVSAVLGAFL